MKIILMTLILLAPFCEAFAQETSAWTDRVNLLGDLRYRHEYSRQSQSNASDSKRHRGRIRARLGLEMDVNEKTDLFLRISTSEGARPTTGNQTLKQAANKKDIYLDWAFARYRPGENSEFRLGKMENPLERPAGSQLIFDSDLTPEGLSASYRMNEESFALTGRLVSFWVEERNTSPQTQDSGMLGGQFVGEFPTTVGNFEVLAGYYSFTNLKGQTALFDLGNSLTTGDLYLHDYNLISGGLVWTQDFEFGPLAAYADYVHNTSVGDENSGWLLGVIWGKIRQPGDWKLSYSWRTVDKDAVLAGWQDSDFAGGTIDTRGHELGFGYGLDKGIATQVTYSNAKLGKSGAERDYTLILADLMFVF